MFGRLFGFLISCCTTVYNFNIENLYNKIVDRSIRNDETIFVKQSKSDLKAMLENAKNLILFYNNNLSVCFLSIFSSI